jgi:hypothetical protein
VLDLGGGNPQPVALAETDVVVDWSRNGRRLLVAARPEGGPNDLRFSNRPLEVMDLDGTGRRKVVEARPNIAAVRRDVMDRRFTPDGRAILDTVYDPKTLTASLSRIDIESGERTCLVAADENEFPYSFCYSQDGRHLAVVFERFARNDKGGIDDNSLENRLVVLDAEGKLQQTLKAPPALFVLLGWGAGQP